MNTRVILASCIRGACRTCPNQKAGIGSQRESELVAVTAEFAVALPAVTAMLALCMGAASVGIAQLKLEESARVAARAAARGDSEAEIRAAIERIDPNQALRLDSASEIPGGSEFTADFRARQVNVTITRAAPGVIGSTTGWVLKAEARARVEGGENEGE